VKKQILAFAVGFALPFSAQAAPVEWDFIATGCTSDYDGCISGQHYPVTLATLTLPGLNSSGSAVFKGGGIGPAAYTGDSFSLDWSAWYPPLTPAFTQNAEPFGECEWLGEMCEFDLSWSEQAGQLDALRLYVNGFSDTLGNTGIPGGLFGLSGGSVASDNIYFGAGGAFAGCEGPPCRVAGFWVDPVPEPGMLMMLVVLGISATLWQKRSRHHDHN
jgi:hypothetical protein